jgi:hypothetical protein
MDPTTQSETISRQEKWLGMKYPRQEVVFFAQIVMVYTVVIASIVNLSLGHDNTNLWMILLSSCLGYLLPNPSIKKNGSFLHNATQ